MDGSPTYKKTFRILSAEHDLPFEYLTNKNRLCSTTIDDAQLDLAVDMGLIEVLNWKEPNLKTIFKGSYEPILNGDFKLIKPSDDGQHLDEKRIGDFQCVRCGATINITQDEGKFTEPERCPQCERKGKFIPLFRKELLKPIWKLPSSAMECSAIELYENIFSFIQEYLVLNPDEYHIMTLWIMASYLVDDFRTVPYLLFIAPKESGKSQAMRVLDQLAYRAFLAASVTPAALFRAIELWKITLLIDEAEFQIKNDTESGQALYQSLNMGYKRDSYAIRIEKDTNIPTPFDVFGFKAIASTKIFLPTLESRSIIIHMSQAKPKKIIIDDNQGNEIRSKLLYFRFTHLGQLPILQPDSISGRIIEIMTPLFTVSQIFKNTELIKSVITYAKLIELLNGQIEDLESERKTEEADSTEAIILEAIQRISENSCRDELDKIFFKEIARELSWIDDRDSSLTRETTTKATMKIGYCLKAMGIKTYRTKKGRLIYLNKPDTKNRIDEMTKRYLKSDLTV